VIHHNKLLIIIAREWNKELIKCATSDIRGKPSLTKALHRAFGFKFALVGFLPLLEECGFR